MNNRNLKIATTKKCPQKQGQQGQGEPKFSFKALEHKSAKTNFLVIASSNFIRVNVICKWNSATI